MRAISWPPSRSMAAKVEATDNTYALTMDQNYAVTADFEVIPDVPQVMFENDFESVSGDKFPFHGWTLKSAMKKNTWKSYTYFYWKEKGQRQPARLYLQRLG